MAVHRSEPKVVHEAEASPRAGWSDAEWVARVRAGDVGVYGALFRRHYPALVVFAGRFVGSRAEAEEVVQDVLLRVWTARESWEVRETVESYLFGAVRNRAWNVRARARIADHWARRSDGETLAMDADVETRLDAAELVQVIRRAVERLPERCRTTFTLSRQHELTYSEIADAMGISVKTVNEQMGRALKAIRAAVAGWRRGLL